MHDYENYIVDFYKGQISNMTIDDLLLLEEMGLDDKALAQEFKIPKSYMSALLYEHRKDF